MAMFPHLRLREDAGPLLDLPWEQPLGAWPREGIRFRDLPVGPSRHLVRFLVAEARTYALKELPLEVAVREYRVLRHLEEDDLPAVRAIGIAEAPERDAAILITEYLAHSLQYRRLLSRFPAGPHPYRTRLLDAMAWLLVDLHRSGVFWGDCSLANTLFRRDGHTIQAYLVDAETSEAHPQLSDGQRRADLEILVENVAFGLADLAALQGRLSLEDDDPIEAAEAVRDRYLEVWTELAQTPELDPRDRHAVRARIRRLNELGFTVSEVELEPGPGGQRVRLRVAVTTRDFHAKELRRRTGVRALEGQARLLLNDLREYAIWVECSSGRAVTPADAAARWLGDVYLPTIERLAAAVGPRRDLVQAYCDVLEHKWLASEREGRDVGLETAIRSYLAAGAPAPERVPEDARDIPPELVGLDLESGTGPDGTLGESTVADELEETSVYLAPDAAPARDPGPGR